MRRFILLAVLVFAPALPFGGASADTPPTLLVLAHREAGGISADTVPAADGVVVLQGARTAQSTWEVRAGAVVDSTQRPPARRVDFFEIEANGSAKRVGAIEVRYFPDKGGFAPRYRVMEEVMLARVGDAWVPLKLVDGTPALTQFHSDALPNVEGYYPYLDFGLTVGAIRIDRVLVSPLDSALSPSS